VRKAYIVQFAPSGAEVVRPQPGGGTTRTPADDESRQYEVLRAGQRVTREAPRPGATARSEAPGGPH
jgi:aminoglycoside phosphotransferase (APT) family kinase protein